MSLDQEKLKDNILNAINHSLPGALSEGFESTFTRQTPEGKEKAEKFSYVVCNIFSEAFADELAAAIDTYIKNATIYGSMTLCNLKTVGSPTAQTSIPMTLSVDTTPTGKGGGSIPNINSFNLGIK